MNRFILALAALAACDDGTTNGNETAETGDTDVTDCPNGNFVGETQVESGTVQCDATATINVSLTGVSAPGSAVVFMQETGNTEPNWSEEHDLDTLSTDVCLASEELEQVIETLGDATSDWVNGSSSVFTCAGHFGDPEVMTFAAFVVDADDASVTSCLAWGHDPAGLIAGDYDRVGIAPSFSLSGCAIGTR